MITEDEVRSRIQRLSEAVAKYPLQCYPAIRQMFPRKVRMIPKGKAVGGRNLYAMSGRILLNGGLASDFERLLGNGKWGDRLLDFEAEISPSFRLTSSDSKSLESKAKDAITSLELKTELERLLGREKRSLEQAAAEVGVSVTTVRRVCRTLGLGRYAPDANGKAKLSRSSQVPFGWVSDKGVIREAPAEMRWVRAAREMRAKGQSYHAIASHYNERGAPTKNGGR